MALEPTLIVVTALSLTFSAALAFALMRSTRQERLRSEARVTLLQDLAADQDDLVLRSDDPAEADRPEIFHIEADSSPWVRRFGAIAAIALVVIAAAWGWTALAPRSRSPAATQGAASHPLELLSLQHARAGHTFTVMGLVQNPRGGGQLNRAEATVLLFDNRGTMLASGRAPLDFTALAAGDESPFVIRVPVTGTVTRYRVGFRSHDGRVLGHLDRRDADSIAQRQEP